jgi:hypothetical protein
VGPSLLADTPEARAVGNLVVRIHDVYIVPIQVGLIAGRYYTIGYYTTDGSYTTGLHP